MSIIGEDKNNNNIICNRYLRPMSIIGAIRALLDWGADYAETLNARLGGEVHELSYS